MKNKLLFFLFFTGIVNAQIITNLDVNFKNKLLASSVNDPIATDKDGQGIIVDQNNDREIDIQEASKISNLYISNCGITNLEDIKYFINLLSIDCSNNDFKKLDLSNQLFLINFKCNSNQSLQQLFIKNGNNDFLGDYSFKDNPNLKYICVDEFEKIDVQNATDNYGYTDCVVNSYCTFKPGGNYYTVQGKVYFDLFNDGCSNKNPVFKNFKINTTEFPENEKYTAETIFTNNNTGSYNYYSQNVDLKLNPSFENPTYFKITPQQASVNFSNDNKQTQNFCITANGIHNDLKIVLAPVVIARPGFDATYQLVFKNKGNQTLSGDISLSFDGKIINFISALPAIKNQTNGTLTWEYNDLLPFETRTIDIRFNVNSTVATPPVNLGDILKFTAIINPIKNDDLPNDNNFVYKQKVASSLLSNTITCLEGENISANNDYLHYKIDFENIGSDVVNNVVVESELDLTKFDIKTLQILQSTNDVEVIIKGGVLKFIYPDIFLRGGTGNPRSSGGSGGILLQVSPIIPILQGVVLNSNANIFFDYNSPTTTNTTATVYTNSVLSNTDFKIDTSITIYPNPVKDRINIKANTELKSIQLFDIQGRILQIKYQDKNDVVLDVSSREKGVYFLKIITENGTKVQKIIKE